MFSLHEKTQRRVCRAAFLIFCVLPTLWTVVWIAHFYRPWRYDDWQRELSHRFHVRVSVTGIESPRPGVTKLAQVEIADLRSNQSLATIETLQIEHQGSRIALGAEQVELPIGQIRAFARSIETCFAATDLPPTDFHAKHLVIVGADGKRFELTNLRLRGEVRKTGEKQIQLLADVGQGESKSTVKVVLENQSAPLGAGLVAKFDTQQAKLPAWLMAGAIPGSGRCAEATFSGKGLVGPSGNSGKLQGRFSQVDLKQWIGPLSPYRVKAVGSLQLERVEWDADGVKLVQGQLRVGAGQIDRSLMTQFEKLLHCVPTSAARDVSKKVSGNWQTFDELSCNFEITSRGMTLTGTCETVPNQTGCLMAFERQPLLLQPEYTEIPTSRLTRVLFPQADSAWLPLVSQAIEMIQSLPIPSLTPKPVPKTTTRNDTRKKTR